MRILLIEDYTPLRENITESLNQAGYVVDASATGDEGLWFAENGNYDVTILDLMLPEIDALFIAIKTLLFGVHVAGWLTLTVAIFFLGGIQLLSIGILGEPQKNPPAFTDGPLKFCRVSL